LFTVVVVVAVLYFVREIFIPLALALLLAFLLAPLVVRLRRWGLGRTPPVIIVVLVSFLLLGVIGAVMVSQLTDLAHKLPGYQHNVHQKLEALRNSGSGVINRITRVAHRVTEELTPPGSPTQGQPGEGKPMAVEIRRSPFSPVEVVQKVLGSLVNALLTAGMVIVFVIFILIEQEDLRDRLIRLAGARRVNLTTKVLDDAAGRVSRYLLAQLLVNLTYGTVAGIALYFIHVPNPLLWGLTAALLRYIPYLGIWVAAVMAAGVAFAVDPGWTKAAVIPALFFGIDLLMYNLVEPLLYGSSTGVSPLAILVAAVFWAWLWGPVGLLLATPLTVCVVVVGRHVPNLEFLSVIFSDEQALRPETRFYQRLLAMDLEEATEIAEEFLRGKSLEELYDALVIPALSLAEADRHRGRMDEARQRFILQNTRILVEDLAERAEDLIAGNSAAKTRGSTCLNEPMKVAPAPGPTAVLCLPARDEIDEIAALMLTQLLGRAGWRARPISIEALARDPLEAVGHERAPIACVFAVPPFGYMHARYLCRRLREQFHQIRLVAAVLTEGDVEEIRARQPPIIADRTVTSLKQAVAEVVSMASGKTEPSDQEPAASAG
jgi:predicted PurR-regulated permease PerM